MRVDGPRTVVVPFLGSVIVVAFFLGPFNVVLFFAPMR